MSRQILAIDIRTHSLSAVLLTTGIKSMTIDGAVVIPFEQPPEQQDSFQHALSRLDSQLPMTGAEVVVGLPGNRSFYRPIEVPFNDPKKIRQILAFELEPTLPVPVDRIVFDFLVNEQNDSAKLLTAVTDRHYIEYIIECFSSFGHDPQLIIPGGFAMAAILANHQHLPEQFLVMDVEANHTNLFALCQNHILMVRSIQLDMKTDDAMKGLISKIRQTLAGYNDSTQTAFSPTTLFVTGAGLAAQDITAPWTKGLNMAVEWVDLRQANPKIEAVPSLDQWQPMLSDGALALALVQAEGTACLAYHRTGSAFHSFWDNYKPYVKGPIILTLLIIFFFLSEAFWGIHILQQRVDSVEHEISTAITTAFPDVGAISARPTDQMRSKLTEFKKNMVNPTHTGSQARMIDILHQISVLIPKKADVLLNRLVIGGDSVTIAGETIDFNTVEDVKSRLENSKIFKQVDITSSDRDKSGQKVRFRLKIDL